MKEHMTGNKKGFTLAELMGVIIILAAITLVVIPIVDKNIKTSREEAYNRQIVIMQNSAKDWTLKNLDSLPDKEGDMVTITLAQLKQGGFVPLNIKNPITEKLFSNNTTITVIKRFSNYEYAVNVASDIDNEEYDENAPIIILTGSYLEYAEISSSNTPYVDKGFTAKSSDGTSIPSDEVTIQYLLNKREVGSINTNAYNTYQVKYSVIKNNIMTTVSRTIIVRDTTPPVLKIPENAIITIAQIESFNALTGTSVTDNSGETLTITVSGSIENEPGRYILTYTATDSSGNVATQKRIITVA